MCMGARQPDIKTPAMPDVMPFQRANPMMLSKSAMSQLQGKGTSLSSLRMGSKRNKPQNPMELSDSSFGSNRSSSELKNFKKIKDNKRKEQANKVLDKVRRNPGLFF